MRGLLTGAKFRDGSEEELRNDFIPDALRDAGKR